MPQAALGAHQRRLKNRLRRLIHCFNAASGTWCASTNVPEIMNISDVFQCRKRHLVRINYCFHMLKRHQGNRFNAASGTWRASTALPMDEKSQIERFQCRKRHLARINGKRTNLLLLVYEVSMPQAALGAHQLLVALYAGRVVFQCRKRHLARINIQLGWLLC